jgi:predicted dehydrogenase
MNNNQKVRIGLIGAGFIAGRHAKALLALKDEAEIAAVCETSEPRGREFQAKYGIPKLCADYREILADKSIDMVNVCTPAFNHSAITCEALRAGKWVMCEKPVGGSLKEVDDILAAEEETGRRAASIFQNRVGLGMRILAELMRTGKTGRPLLGLCETFWHRDQNYYKAAWSGTWKGEMGGCLMTQAIHIIDLLVSIMGEMEWVSADAANLKHRIEVDDCSAATVRFKNGSMANVISTICNHEDSSRLRVIFENLTALSPEDAYSFGSMPWRFFSANAGLQKEIDACVAKFKSLAEAEGHLGQLKHFIRAYREKAEPLVNIREARISLELIAGIYKSAITGMKTGFPIAKDDPFYFSMNGGQQLRGAIAKL